MDQTDKAIDVNAVMYLRSKGVSWLDIAARTGMKHSAEQLRLAVERQLVDDEPFMASYEIRGVKND